MSAVEKTVEHHGEMAFNTIHQIEKILLAKSSCYDTIKSFP